MTRPQRGSRARCCGCVSVVTLKGRLTGRLSWKTEERECGELCAGSYLSHFSFLLFHWLRQEGTQSSQAAGKEDLPAEPRNQVMVNGNTVYQGIEWKFTFLTAGLDLWSYLHTHTHTYMHTHMHTHARMHTHTCPDTRVYMHTHVHTHSYIHAYIVWCACVCTCMCVWIQVWK